MQIEGSFFGNEGTKVRIELKEKEKIEEEGGKER